jgi:hypothetical protein
MRQSTSLASRNVCRICFIVSSLRRHPPLPVIVHEAQMPELLTQLKTQQTAPPGGRLHLGTVADIKSESPAGFSRYPQQLGRFT